MASTRHSRIIPALPRGLATLGIYLDELERSTEKSEVSAPHAYETAQRREPEDRVRFLTADQAESWRAAHELPDPSAPAGIAGGKLSFTTERAGLAPAELVTALLGDAGESRDERMVHITDWIWDDDYEQDPSAPLRERFGEARPLDEVPAGVFPGSRIEGLLALLGVVIERNWTAILYLPAEDLIVRLLPEGKGEICALKADAEELMRYRLIELGVECDAA